MANRSKKYFISLFILKLCGLCVSIESGIGDDCKQLNILYRHGDRSPTNSYPKDFYPQSIWPQGLGQLSKEGMMQQYLLGKFLRHRYDGFIYSNYTRSQVYIRSTDMDRTLMSAYSNLAGLFPPKGEQEWNPDIHWQPIPVHTKPGEEDPLLKVDYKCPRYDQLQDEMFKKPKLQEHEKHYKDVYKYVSNYTGIPHENIRDIWKVYDILFCQQQHGYDLPGWAADKRFFNRTVYDILQEFETLNFNIMYNSREKARLRAGMLVKEVGDNMQVNIDNDPHNPDTSITTHIYSAHDTTLTAYLSALGVYNDMQPPFVACIMTELHYTPEKGHYVQVWYRNTTHYNDSTTEPHKLHIPGCDEDCPFDKFIALTKDVTITYQQLQAACLVSTFTKTNIIILGAVGGSLVFLIVVSVVCYLWKRQRDIRYERYQQAETA